MAKGFKHGDGGLPLNFKVVGGTTQPANTKENTLWVNTNEKITTWVVSDQEPNMSKNLVRSFSINSAVSHYADALYVNAELLPNTTYTLSLVGKNDNRYYLNEKITATRHFTIVSGRNNITFTTHSTLDKSDSTQWSEFHQGWILLKNSQAQGNAHIFKDVQLEKGSSHDGTYVPYGGIEGGVWIPTGAASPIDINALKKNGIIVRPTTVKQYLSGVWKKKDALVYQSGCWNSLESVIAPNKNITWVNSNASVNQTSESTQIAIAAKADPHGTATTSYSYCIIDTTGYDTLYIACTTSVNNTTGSDQTSEVLLGDLSGSVVSSVYYKVIKANTNDGTKNYSKTIDISALSGLYRIKCNATSWTANATCTHNITLTDCRMY